MPDSPAVTWQLILPDYWPPSLNHTQMAHWSANRKHKKRALELLHIYALASGGIPKFTGPCIVELKRLYCGRRKALDKDNLWGSTKPLVDAMRARQERTKQGGLGIIEDDDDENVTLSVVQQCLKPAAMPDMPGRPGQKLTLATVITITGTREA